MKNPNGYGSVVKLSGNRRRPYAVRKTIGWNEKGHPIYICIGYTATREEGMLLLADYNRNPYDLSNINITTKELYERWFECEKKKMSKSLSGSIAAAWKHCTFVYDISYRELKSFHMQSCIDNCPLSYSTKAAIKNLFQHLDKFALELDIINKCRSQLLSSPPIPETSKIPFSGEEIDKLWSLFDKEWIDTVLIFIYTGLRISELLNMKCSDVNLKEMTMTGGTKTEAGKNRVIPIHPRILPFIKKRVSGGNEFLITYKGKKCSPYKYYNIWNRIMADCKMTHTPHECRHTFRSMMDSAGANKKCIDLIMGHKSKDVGERVYTHKTLEELHEAILTIK
ncbi:MAG: site-specific integrase [Lachnospiraceae bacterium]|nr:site-specific integrase [Lachnospiraceae bacterium]